jgi:hypothetical protein
VLLRPPQCTTGSNTDKSAVSKSRSLADTGRKGKTIVVRCRERLCTVVGRYPLLEIATVHVYTVPAHPP